MYDVVIIGGSLSGMIAAVELSKKYKVCIVDINQEIGFPTNFPGLIKNISLIEELFESKEQSKLYLMENDNGWGFRSEWLMKYLTHSAAKQGVEILNRTKVTDVFFDSCLNLDLIGGGPKNKIIKTKTIIDESYKIEAGPGKINHVIPISNKNIINNKIQIKKFFVGTALSNDDFQNLQYDLIIRRQDDLTELWFEIEPREEPKNGWIEIKRPKIQFPGRLMVVDDHFKETSEILEQLKTILT